jgi:hypothetical protein
MAFGLPLPSPPSSGRECSAGNWSLDALGDALAFVSAQA